MKQVTVLSESLNHSLDQFVKKETVVPEITVWVWVGTTFEEITSWPFCIHWMCVVRMKYRHTTSTMSFSDATLLLFTTPRPLPHGKLICPSDAHLGITLSSWSPRYFSPAVLCSPGSLEYVHVVRFSAKWYYVAFCMFRDTFKVKCLMINAKSKFIFIRWVALKGSIAPENNISPILNLP